MILYCASDLLWATRIKATADALGIPCRPARNPEMLDARLADCAVRGLIVDLDAGDNALAVIRRVRRSPDPRARTIPIVAFGPHVAVAALDEARGAGADRVLSRGAFHRQLPELLASLGGQERGTDPE